MTRKGKTENEDALVLIVEDSSTEAQKLIYYIEEAGFRVHRVTNGIEAVTFLEKTIPTIVLSDVVMPEMNGYQLCALMKKDRRWKHIPVILVTSLSAPNDIITGLESGADHFLTKPYESHYLVSRIQSILANCKLRKNGRDESPRMKLEIYFNGKKHNINAERMQIVDLLFSSYDSLVEKNEKLERLNHELMQAREKIKVLKGFIPICANCKQIRDDDGYWQELETYIKEHSEAKFSHAICPECRAKIAKK